MTFAHGALAGDLLDAFGSRLRHVHVSSLSTDLHHVPLTAEDEALFMPVLERCLDLPLDPRGAPTGS
jgi:hypothetical protein